MIASLENLATASGASWKNVSAGALRECKTVSSLLNAFLVGTERTKKRSCGTPPKPSKLKPFREYEIMNPARQLKQLTNRTSDAGGTANRLLNKDEPPLQLETDDSQDSAPDSEPNMGNCLVQMKHSNLAMEISVSALAAAMEVEGSELTSFAGYRLLKYRANLTHGVNEQVRKNAEQAQTQDIKGRLFPTALYRKRQYRTGSEGGNSDNASSTGSSEKSKKSKKPCAHKASVGKQTKKKHYSCIMFGGTCTGSTELETSTPSTA